MVTAAAAATRAAKGFCYLREADEVVMLKATREEQAALIAEAPDTFSAS